jgi:hypothetical protein
MTNQINGETSSHSSSASQRLVEIDKILDEYEQKLGLPNYEGEINKQRENIGLYLAMGRTELEKLDIESCGYISFELRAYGVFIQRSINRERARLNWANSVFKNYVCPKFDSVNGYGFDEKACKVTAQDEYASKLDSIIRYAKQRTDRLEFLANGINGVADALDNIKKGKMVKQ